jgi:hypothetical protein
MSAYPPPTDLTPVFNRAQFQTTAPANLDTAYLDAHYLQYPVGQGNITVPSAIVENGLTTGANILMEPNGNPPTNYLQFPDGSKQTTANGSSSNVLNSNNQWNGTNQYNVIPTTTTSTSAPGNQVATTEYVAAAISNAIHNITPTVPTVLNWTFDPTAAGPQTKSFTIPDTAYSYVFSALGCGGLAGSPTNAGTVYASGGQGGGGAFACPYLLSQTDDNIPPIYEAQVNWKGKIILGQLVSYNGQLAVALTLGSYPTLYVYCGGNGANGNTTGFAAGGSGANVATPPNITTWDVPSTYDWTASTGVAGSSGDFLSNPPPNSVPVVALSTPYTPPVNGVGTYNYGQAGAFGGFPNDYMFSGENGTGQLYATSSLSGFTYTASPVGLGQISFTINYTDPATIGGQNAQFVSFNNTTLATSTQTFLAGTGGLAVQNTSSSRSLGLGAGGFLVNGTSTVDPLNLLPITDTAIPTTLAVNNEIILQDNEVLSAAQNTIQIQSSQIGVGANFGIDYESLTNQPFTIQSAGSSPILFKQYGLGATTQQLVFDPTEVILQDTAQSNTATLTIGQLAIDDGGGNDTTMTTAQFRVSGAGSIGAATNTNTKTGILISDIDNTTSPNFITRQSNLINNNLQFFNQVAFGYSNQLSVSLNNNGGGGASGIYHNDNFPTPSSFTIQSTTDLNLESSAADVNLNSHNSLTITALDTAGTGKGIFIGKTTPNIYYELNTASPFDRLTIDNNGTIETVSVSNSAITSINPNSIVLQKPATSSALDMSSDAGLQFSTAAGITSTYSATQLAFTTASTLSATGYRGAVYHTDQPTTAQTYYLTFVQSGGASGYYAPCFDSATLTYNPNSNLLLVNGLQLSTTTNTTTFAANSLTIDCNSASSREFNFPITAAMNGLNLTSRRVNGVYKVMITNSSGASQSINSALATTTSQPNRTSYISATIAVGETWIMTIKVQNFNGTNYNCVSLEQFV